MVCTFSFAGKNPAFFVWILVFMCFFVYNRYDIIGEVFPYG